MKKTIPILAVSALLLLISAFPAVAGADDGPIIIDHTCTDLDAIPETWLDEAKELTIHYAHTSHGSQITTGLETLETLYPDYALARRQAGTEGLPPAEDPPALRMYDGNPPETYIEPDDYWNSAAGLDRTRAVADTGHYDFSMWAWCGQLSWYSNAQVQDYLDAMDQLESEYPDMRFIYMTGHLDGSGEAGMLHQNNEIIRQYCQNNNKVLFDFAGIESYDPDGVYYLDQGGDDYCNYNGGNWADEWCAANPGSDLCADCDCAHSRPLNCNQKSRAFWWMMARLAGWDGMPADGAPATWYVDASATGANDGTAWPDAYTNLQSALADAQAGDQIWVAAGTYTPAPPGQPGTRTDFFRMKNGVGIYGGFPGTGNPGWDDRDWYTNKTVLSGEIGNPGTVSDNCYHLFYHPGSLGLNNTAVLDGFTITGGYADGDPPYHYGGGMFNTGGSPTITNCTFFANHAQSGGAMRNESASPVITNCVFRANWAAGGGAMYNWDHSCPILTNCVIYGNWAEYGGGIRNWINSSPTITNTIVWGIEPITVYQSDPDITFCDIKGGYDGAGNIAGTPMFVDPENGDFRLLGDSPCIDAGTNSAPNLSDVDLQGNARIANGTADMGVFEFTPWDPWNYDTDESGDISKPEALQAVVDYFDGLITKSQALEVIVLYFG